MTQINSLHPAAFGNMLTESYISGSIPPESNIDASIEMIKGKASALAISMFNAGKKDITFENEKKFSDIFSQDKYAAGFTKGLAGIMAYLICFDEMDLNANNESLNTFVGQVKSKAAQIHNWVLSGNKSALANVRKALEQIDNYGGYYSITSLSPTSTDKLVSDNFFKGLLIKDPLTGHIVVKISDSFTESLLDAYRPEIEKYLTEEGKQQLKLPHNTGFVVVVYKDEQASIPTEKLDELLNSGQEIALSILQTYIVPVRGDDRYRLVASIKLKSEMITDIRASLGLKELYSEGRPLRFTFAAVHALPEVDNYSQMVMRMQKSPSLKPWMEWIATSKV